MKRWLALALLVALPVAAQDRFPRCRSGQGRSDRGFACDSAPFFEFAPASGAGLGAPCACAAVTGAKGEAVTWTRGSSAMCTKSASETSIANGDLVLCASNQPRVMSLGGPLGVLPESSRQNVDLQSQSFDNVGTWLNFIGTGGANPVVTANQGTAPDSSATSPPEQVAFAATTGAQASMLTQAAMTAAAYSVAVYAQYVSGTCNLDLCVETNSVGPVATCTSTSVASSTTWTRLKTENVTSIVSGRTFIGNGSAVNGGSARSACTVLLWQADAQLGAYMLSAIPTTTVPVTRLADANSVPSVPVDATGCVSATVTPLWSGSNGPANPMVVGTNAARYLYLRSSGFNQWATFDAVTDVTLADAWTGFAQYRAVARWGGATQTLVNVTRSTTNSGAFDGTKGVGAFSIGADATLGQVDAIVSRVQLDPNRGVCQ